MNNYHRIISLRGAAPEIMGRFFSQKKDFHVGGQTFLGKQFMGSVKVMTKIVILT